MISDFSSWDWSKAGNRLTPTRPIFRRIVFWPTLFILPRHEIARVSELLQSQLLQPLNMTPIQPHLAESNLFLISAGGPAALSFNEFNPLFNRNGVNFQTTGLAGENNTYAGEGVLSGIYQKAAFSLGGFHFQTNGWRNNANQKDIGNAYVQLELTPQTSVQAEVRHREMRRGDIQQRFIPEFFFSDSIETTNSYSARVGGRHAFSTNSTVLGSFIFQDRKDTLGSKLSSDKIELPQTSFASELQHIFRSRYLDLTSGIGYSDVDAELRDSFQPDPLNQDIRHLNVYNYANINLVRTLTITAGMSYDNIKGKTATIPNGKVSQFNPKFGIMWNPLPSTLIRAAILRSIKRTLITDQTLEPTQVTGFNQFFDDFDATKAWRYGAGIDQKLSNDFFAGVEFSKRELKIPLIDLTGVAPVAEAFNGNEYLGRSYLFWTPHKWLALRSGYVFEGFRNDPDLGEVVKLNTHRVSLGLNFSHPSGISVSTTGTYTWQNGDLAVNLPIRSSFWLVDTAFNYRLPKRYGFISIGATNLLDKKFKYFEVDRNNPRIQPSRTMFFRLTLALP